MIRITFKTFLFSILMASTYTALIGQIEWTFDKGHSKIAFAATHMGIAETDGNFKEFDGKVTTATTDFTGAKVEFTANTASVFTDNERRDGHLKSDDFFNAELFPELKFNGSISKEGNDMYLVGDLTIRDITKPIKFNVKHGGTVDGRGGPKAGFKITGEINRFDYNLKFDRAMPGGDLVVGKTIEIRCNVELNGKDLAAVEGNK